MDSSELRALFQAVARGEIDPDNAADRAAGPACLDLGYARLDLGRAHRQGFPEVVFGQGKSREQVVEIFARLAERESNVLATRIEPAAAEALLAAHPEARWNRLGRTVALQRDDELRGLGTILVATGGTSDIPVAEEAVETARVMGNRVETLYDAGVAGLHRLLGSHGALRRANVVIAVAGMEGALASVIGGLVDRPVIAVPTSVGYGTSLGGLAALLAMLNSCASNVAVVNVDNGFGAAFVASLANRPPRVAE